MSLDTFHLIVRTWFERRFGVPTDAQALGWPAIASGRHTLIAAPTGSGKTLAAFLTRPGHAGETGAGRGRGRETRSKHSERCFDSAALCFALHAPHPARSTLTRRRASSGTISPCRERGSGGVGRRCCRERGTGSGAGGCDAGGVRVAAEGAGERHPAEPARAAGGDTGAGRGDGPAAAGDTRRGADGRHAAEGADAPRAQAAARIHHDA